MLSVSSIMQEDDRDEIKCIFFSEFHPTAGPKIFSQVPEDYIKKEDFDFLHAYIITKPELKDRTITINAQGHKIVGCPVCIDDSKYARNALIFNLCFVFDASASTQQYEMVVKKLADYLTTLEVESHFLSTEETKNQLPDIMKAILEDINLLGSCEIPINECMSIRLKVVRPRPDPDKVLGHCVPVCTSRLPIGGQWDLATQQLLPYIDGYRHVAKMAAEADIDIHIVKACLQNLVFHRVIKIIPIFQYSNVYVTTPDIRLLAEDEELQDECLTFVSKPGKLINLRDVFQLYCGLTAGVTVRDLCTRHNPHALGIDERKLIQFGLIKGIIRRLEKYPIKLPCHAGNSKIQHLYKWFNGKHSYDEICCKNGISCSDLEEKVESDPSVVIIWK